MDHLFTPWRMAYVAGGGSGAAGGGSCVLCALRDADPADDEASFIVHRAPGHYVVLNIYPYTSGHVMVVPHEHASRLAELSEASLSGLARLAARAEAVLEEVYRPEGINLGMNLGRCAGAGMPDHLHLHVVPRWTGDTAFMTVTGATRVLPEDLRETWRRLRGRF